MIGLKCLRHIDHSFMREKTLYGGEVRSESMVNKKISKKDPMNPDEWTPNEKLKWEVAKELGLFDKVLDQGWKSLSAKESGRIGGIVGHRKKIQQQAKKNDSC